MTSNCTRGKEARVAQRIPRVANRKLHVTESSALLVGLALVDFMAHMLVSGNYGYFRDELYYKEAGRHLAFGYVDFPPFIALLVKFLGVLAGPHGPVSARLGVPRTTWWDGPGAYTHCST
jgi:hypothetical protein